MKGLGFFSLSLFALSGVAAADEYLIRSDGTGDFPTIQVAIIASSHGDVIRLAAGTYQGEGNRDVDFLGKNITVRSDALLPESCVIDCQGSPTSPRRAFIFQSGEDASALIHSLTITNGWAADGGGVYIDDGCSPQISNCVVLSCIADNTAHSPSGGYGGGIYCYGRPLIQGCEFRDNEAGNRGGGIYAGGDAQITNCILINNHASDGGGIHCRQLTSVVGCLLVGNTASTGYQTGGGISCRNHLGNIVSCTLYGNEASAMNGGGGVAFYGDGPAVARCIVANSTSGGGLGWGYGGANSAPTVSCCDLWNNAGGFGDSLAPEMIDGGGNISGDPLFCNVAGSDFHLDEASPCRPWSPQNPACDLVGAYPVGCSTPVHNASWGFIKAMFR